jgi:hypothetical protein
MYTRKVYLEYRETFTKSTTFRMEPNPAVRNGYLVKHQRGGDEFCWANHAFRVHAELKTVSTVASVDNGNTQVMRCVTCYVWNILVHMLCSK